MTSKIKYQLEFPIRSSVKILYGILSTPSGLSEWFADNVNLKGDTYIFIWDGSEQVAKVLSKKNNQSIRFQWEDEDEDTYFELKIEVDDITNDVSLIITDFADDEDDVADAKLLWGNQVEELRSCIGS
jgi:uncharacterized protein YndB with AHSA1/START domain